MGNVAGSFSVYSAARSYSYGKSAKSDDDPAQLEITDDAKMPTNVPPGESR